MMKRQAYSRIGIIITASVLALAVVTLRAAYAGTQVVTSTADSGAGSLRSAVAAAAAGDTITFAVSPVTLTSGPVVINKNLTLQGPVTISGGGTVQVLNITCCTVTISEVTITGGNAGGGSGGGINHTGGALTVAGSTITGNSAPSGSGAGIYSAATLNVTNSVISNNTAASGGGAGILTTGSLTLTNSTISGNVIPNFGGGGLEFFGSATVTGNLITGNTSAYSAAIGTYGGSSSGNISNNCIEANTSTDVTGFDVERVAGTAAFNNNWWGVKTGPNTSSGETFGASNAGPPVASYPAFLTERPSCGASAGIDLCADGRLNCDNGTEYAILYRETDTENKPKLHLYCLTVDGKGSLAGIITQADFEQFPEKPETNTKVKEFYNEEGCRVPVSFWVLTTGEYQMVIGPNWKGDMIRVIFTGLPPERMYVKKCNVLIAPNQCED